MTDRNLEVPRLDDDPGEHQRERGSAGKRLPEDTSEQLRIGPADDPGGRREWFRATRRDTDGESVDHLYLRGSRQRHSLTRPGQGPREAPAAPGGPGSVNWTPIGPSVIAHGQASGDPPVSGRITSLAVGPAGARAYAGAANGGVWFSGDSGSSWNPLDEYAVCPR